MIKKRDNRIRIENSIYLRLQRLGEYGEVIKGRGDGIGTESTICPRLWRVDK